ncbi:hypothetical protein KUV56_09695 [Ferrimonas balearica]|uniref:hypothetical protein n=1 Tax=Ferrimonas balearica TaxID=44012 RepID=UPI001C5A52DA|nr:hypothetical protein [Ferrimonas balearica]MBW3139789.1 hypothetical protein [Ferrimonas balearica]MBY6107105.1 hypothetical protein [Ferrimonas balearica]
MLNVKMVFLTMALILSGCGQLESSSLPELGSGPSRVEFRKLFKPTADGRYQPRYRLLVAGNQLPSNAVLPVGEFLMIGDTPVVQPGARYLVEALDEGGYRVIAIGKQRFRTDA